MKERQAFTVSAQIRVLHAHTLFLGSFNEHSASAVAKEHAGSAVLVIDERRHFIGTDNNNFLVSAALYHRRSNVEAIEKSAASSLKVEEP